MDERTNLVFLRELGLEIAQKTYERNQFFKDLLLDLGVDSETTGRNACELEHSVSPEFFLSLFCAET